MTWNWFRHRNDAGLVVFSQRRTDYGDLEGDIRTRPATPEEIAKLEGEPLNIFEE